MIFKRKTKQEEQQAINSGDLTGGYNFWPWFFIFKKFFILAIPLLTFLSLGCIWDSYVNNDYVYRISGIVGLIMSGLIALRIRLEFNRKKKGNINS